MTARLVEDDPVLLALSRAPIVPNTPVEEAALDGDFDGPTISHGTS